MPMTRSAALLVLPSEPRSDGEKDALQTNAHLLTQGLEDLHLSERVERALGATGRGPLRSIEITVHARFVILAGRVPSYYLKQLAQETALAVAGVQHVQNDLDVGRPS
jgi:osmotically-inducible protein OsmY